MRRLFVPASLIAVAVVIGLFVLPYGAQSHASTKAASPARSAKATVTAEQSASLSEGQTLFENTCSSCHGVRAQGSELAPNLQNVGAEVVDLWVSSGWMPLANPTSQPIRKPALFNRAQTTAIAVNFVGSLGNGPKIPVVDLRGTSVAEGFSVFALNCAPCHTITGSGDALANGFTAPPLHGLTATQITEAVETGPGNMPTFSAGILSQSEIKDVVAYVDKDIQHPSNPGGLGLGGVGPVAEGFIGLFVGVGACMLVAMWIGDRTVREEAVEHDASAHDGEDGHA